MRYKVAIRFAIEGDLRFISHHDMMRLFERALARSRLPIRFSEGFNPRPRLSLPLPRAVGVSSVDDLLVVQLCEPVEPGDVMRRLAAQVVAGLSLLEGWRLEPGVSVQPGRVAYEVVLPGQSARVVADAVRRVLAADEWLIDRELGGRKGCKKVDLRAYLCQASVEGGLLKWTVRVTATGSARPAEMLAAFGLEPQAFQHHVKRTWVDWQMGQPDNPADESVADSTQTEPSQRFAAGSEAEDGGSIDGDTADACP